MRLTGPVGLAPPMLLVPVTVSVPVPPIRTAFPLPGRTAALTVPLALPANPLPTQLVPLPMRDSSTTLVKLVDAIPMTPFVVM
jgi:hypothetical protein